MREDLSQLDLYALKLFRDEGTVPRLRVLARLIRAGFVVRGDMGYELAAPLPPAKSVRRHVAVSGPGDGLIAAYQESARERLRQDAGDFAPGTANDAGGAEPGRPEGKKSGPGDWLVPEEESRIVVGRARSSLSRRN